MSLKEWFTNGPMRCTSQIEADTWFFEEVNRVMSMNPGVGRPEIEEALRLRLGLATGHFGIEVARKAYEYWKAEHPMFGPPHVREKYSSTDMYMLSKAFGAVAQGRVKAEG